ncbi:hypothetical protein BRE01_48590 [Brevibacillus reuszeri]|uniref:Peptidase metallopeptidase domain-containing protein n=1 Tax=Brevibacillus reuszeri TaxID=54915 RepID=A0A0K9YYR4_9BACL|nr:M57 family metalloprotease [Brevibacillus reuszeri]KNB73782.1 hypothetical protein ADS79_07560 [Brevibacillus reuszeri]MED1861700.1 M57 family metalloprotease [Brevibacillus reuszeri]GED71157.1 hypothetical protein BRE01_48590 [Brevibacillus reuszeri]
MKRIITVAALLGILSIPSHSFAYNVLGNKFSDNDFYYKLEGTFPSKYSGPLQAAVDSWNDTNTPISFIKSGIDELIEVHFEVPASYGNTSWDGMNAVSGPSGGYYTYASIIINTDLLNYANFDYIKGLYGHEMGHVMGLDHVYDKTQIMCTTANGRKVYVPGSDDIDGINYLYGQSYSNVNPSVTLTDADSVRYSGHLVKNYETADELKKDADLVLEIEATDSSSLEYKNIVFTLINAKVKKEFKAGKKFKDKEIKILETGGYYEGKNYLFEDNEVLKEGDKTIVFLKKYEGPIADDAYVILGAYQGKFNLDKNGNIKESKKLDGRLSEINNMNDLQLDE